MTFRQAWDEIARTAWVGSAFLIVTVGLGILLGLAGLDPRSAVAGILAWTALWFVLGGVFGLKVEVEKWVFKGREPPRTIEGEAGP